MKNVCIVGYGAIGPIHAAALQKIAEVKLYAACDIRPERLALCAEKYGTVSYTDFDEMLRDEKIDSVHICTPHHLHFEMTKKALAAGKTVVCEKPITRTKAEWDELIALENADRVCAVFQNRLNPCIEKLKQIAESGTFGAIKTVKAIVTWNRTNEYYAQDAWRGKWATEGGGVLINQAVHTMDLICYIAGPVSSVQAKMANFSIPEIEVEDTFAAYCKLQNGAGAVFFATNAYGEDSNPLFEVVFEKGKALYDGGKLYLDGELVESDEKPVIGKAYWGKGHEKLLHNYYAENIFFSPLAVKNTMATLFGMYESAGAEGKEIKL